MNNIFYPKWSRYHSILSKNTTLKDIRLSKLWRKKRGGKKTNVLPYTADTYLSFLKKKITFFHPSITYLIFVTTITTGVCGEKKFHVEKIFHMTDCHVEMFLHKRNLKKIYHIEKVLHMIIVGKKWEPRNPVPGPFSPKIRKVNQNSESRREFGK